MEIITGRYGEAKVFASTLEDNARAQIKEFCDQVYTEGAKIRIMPDAHAGAGCTIGTTMTITDKIVPNLVGVDIGCGMLVVKLKEKDLDLAKLDDAIRAYVPSGFSVRQRPHRSHGRVRIEELRCFRKIRKTQAAPLALGTLGGGNHFIEIDRDEDGGLYLVIHSGGRNLALQVAHFYQNLAYEDIGGKNQKEYSHDLAYLEGEHMEDYLADMRIMQRYAEVNRQIMKEEILAHMEAEEEGEFTTIHNYIDLDSMILRKGAVYAKKGEALLIPMNMRDGSLLCTGLGNGDWNYSAPHGAGRLMSRKTAFDTLSLDAFRESMNGIFSTCVSMETIDESPMAYKPMEEIVDTIGDTVVVDKIIKPVYNFKASENSGRPGKKINLSTRS